MKPANESEGTSNPTFEALNHMVLELNVRWQMFDELYADAKNYSVLNRTGANFWATLQNILLDDLMLAISRFLDPPKSLGNDNFSLAAIAALPEVDKLHGELETRLDAMRVVWKKGIKSWRHKKLSHSDMQTVLGTQVLPDVPFSEIKELVDMITAFARELEHRLNRRDVGYRCSITGWVPQVLKYLELGVQKKDEALGVLAKQIEALGGNTNPEE